MKGIKTLLLLLFFKPLLLFAQFHEVGLFLGASNYIGDVGSQHYINPKNAALGLTYKWNINTRYSFRAGISMTKLTASDDNTDDVNRLLRAFTFDNNIQELYAGFEFNFVAFNLHDGFTKVTPYLFVGAAYFSQDLFYIKEPTFEPETTISYGNGQNLALPATVGIKFNPNPLWVIGLEIGVRYAFTDNLDGSNPVGEFESNEALKFGNLNNNDWYVFTGLTFSFTFGDLPCYCKEQ